MNTTLKTAISFAKNLFTVGAINETKPETVEEMCSKINTEKKVIIVEFGMGHGNMTKEILKNISSDSELYSFEINADFCKHVEENIKDDRLRVINDSALNFQKYVLESVDNFIISIPFTFLKDKEAEDLVKSCFNQLNKEGVYSQVVYNPKTLLKAIGNRTYDKKVVKAFINEKIYHVYNK